jgi:hypothetical protein
MPPSVNSEVVNHTVGATESRPTVESHDIIEPRDDFLATPGAATRRSGQGTSDLRNVCELLNALGRYRSNSLAADE